MSTCTYMNIKGQGHSLTMVQGHSVQHFQASFPKKTLGRHMELGLKIYSNVQGHMTNMPLGPYMIKTFKHLIFGIKRPMTLKLCIQQWVLKYYQICSNDDPGSTLTIFMTWSNLFPNASVYG